MARPPTLSAEAVREIRAWFAERKRTRKRIPPCRKKMARKHHISVTMIDHITSLRLYRWVDP